MSNLEITDVRVKLSATSEDDKLVAYCTITLNDAIVIKDIKVIGGDTGPFVAMPSRKITCHCPHCGGKNHLRARYCNDCGKSTAPKRGTTNGRGRERLHFDVVHPINGNVRAMVHDAILREIERVRREFPDGVTPGGAIDDGDFEM